MLGSDLSAAGFSTPPPSPPSREIPANPDVPLSDDDVSILELVIRLNSSFVIGTFGFSLFQRLVGLKPDKLGLSFAIVVPKPGRCTLKFIRLGIDDVGDLLVLLSLKKEGEGLNVLFMRC